MEASSTRSAASSTVPSRRVGDRRRDAALHGRDVVQRACLRRLRPWRASSAMLQSQPRQPSRARKSWLIASSRLVRSSISRLMRSRTAVEGVRGAADLGRPAFVERRPPTSPPNWSAGGREAAERGGNLDGPPRSEQKRPGWTSGINGRAGATAARRSCCSLPRWRGKLAVCQLHDDGGDAPPSSTIDGSRLLAGRLRATSILRMSSSRAGSPRPDGGPSRLSRTLLVAQRARPPRRCTGRGEVLELSPPAVATRTRTIFAASR